MNSTHLIAALIVLAIARNSCASEFFYESDTGLLHFVSFQEAAFTTVEIRSESGILVGEKSDFSHFDGLFDVYNSHRAFKLDPTGFDDIRSFARLPAGMLYDELVEDLSFDGSLVGGGPAGFVLAVSRSCTVCIDFDSPIPDSITIIGGASTGIQVAGGHPFGNLQLTDASPQQAGAIIFPQEMSPANHRLIIGASTNDSFSNHRFDNFVLNPREGETLSDSSNFNLTADVQIGGGSETPGCGFSINVARPDDPVLANAESGVLAGFASSSDGQLNRLEEGATTGLAIGFDESANGEGDTVGISIRVDNQLVAQIPLETVNGAFDDPTSLQTGAFHGTTDLLEWAPLSISVSHAESDDYYGSHLTIDWKEHTVFDGPVAIVGDSNFDKRFDSSDLVHVFTAGLYETGLGATWESGDWNLDGVFDSSDLVTAFSADTFSNQAVQVPESSPSLSIVSALFLSAIYCVRRQSRLVVTLPNEHK